MRELNKTNPGYTDLRWQMLVTVSGAALLASLGGAVAAEANDHPSVWLELGGRLERVDGRQELFLPDFTRLNADTDVFSPLSAAETQRSPRYSVGGEARLSFQPNMSDWVFSAAIRFGRSNSSRLVHQQKHATPVPLRFDFGTSAAYVRRYHTSFFDTQTMARESHMILDFQVGKDVGLGLFGAGNSSLSFGIRVAQFNVASRADLYAVPNIYYGTGFANALHAHRTFYEAHGNIRSSFQGIGPTVSWNASAPLAGDEHDASLDIDWGINAAVLFGRQKTYGSQSSAGTYYQKYGLGRYRATALYARLTNISRQNSVIVPNVGGFAAISYRLPSAKISLGYRVDGFFGAMDSGIGSRVKSDRSFYGPFATISVGLGG